MENKEIKEQICVLLDQRLAGVPERKACVVTYGCQMNACDSEKLAAVLRELGFVLTEEARAADLVIFNTCCVRDHAEKRVYGNVGALRKIKEASGGRMIIGVCGCMMQQKGVAEHIRTRYPFVDMVFGTHNLHEFASILLAALESERTFVDVREKEDGCVHEMPAERKSLSTAYVTIMQGCNNFCTYCVVPYVRGRERSRETERVLDEIRGVAATGCREIMLLGQNVNSYGKDLGGGVNFAALLRQADRIEGIERIRFMTSHPKDLSDELLETMAAGRHICRQLHLPVQSGSDRILKKMNRGYTRADYLTIIEKARRLMPEAGLSTDIIVGFPGETEDDFAATESLLAEVRYTNAFLFKYSPRRGTPAAAMPDQIPEEVKQERHARVMALQNAVTAEANAHLIGRELPVLAESVSKKNDRMLSGRTDSGILVNFSADGVEPGTIVPVRITGATVSALRGERV